jgi:hypothetical protein
LLSASTADVPFCAASRMVMAVVLAHCSVLERMPSMADGSKAPAM